MTSTDSFDLPAFMLSNFNRVDFGPDLFGQRPTGLRFEIGIERVARAAKLFEFVFEGAPNCIVVSQDWVTDEALDSRFTSLFETHGICDFDPARFQAIDVRPLDETEYRLTWTCVPPLFLNSLRMFEGIANREQNGSPKISSGVFVIEPTSKIIMHMYDDRGLDIIGAELSAIGPLYERFDDWILENQRHRIAFRIAAALREGQSQKQI